MLSHYFYVRISMTISKRFRLAGLSLMLTGGLLASGLATAKYPDKPITMYIAFAAGGTTDITGRALAQGIEKILGVPVTIENKGGGGATVANGLLASKKPDGYTLLVTSVGSITMRPLLLKLAYNAQSFRPLMQFSYYIGGLVVNADSPIKTVDEFVDYAKKNPGLTYSSSGPHTQQQIGVEAFARCKGLVFKHMPTKGGSTANTALMGKHVDFVAGSGSHILLVEQGQFRELARPKAARYSCDERYRLSAHQSTERDDCGRTRRSARRCGSDLRSGTQADR
jgi:tripartite-type tricarboxylate transporter receptor subunit TctC